MFEAADAGEVDLETSVLTRRPPADGGPAGLTKAIASWKFSIHSSLRSRLSAKTVIRSFRMISTSKLLPTWSASSMRVTLRCFVASGGYISHMSLCGLAGVSFGAMRSQRRKRSVRRYMCAPAENTSLRAGSEAGSMEVWTSPLWRIIRR